jgi:hypothetical protein
VTPPAVTVQASEVLAVRRELAPGRSLLEHAETAYLAVFTLAIFGSLLLGAWRGFGTFLLDLANPYRSLAGAPFLFLVGLAVLRFSVWQGFVSFSEADCAHVLTAPVPRHDLIWPRLRNTAVLAGMAGAVVGALAVLAPGLHSAGIARLSRAVVAGFALGATLVAMGWQAQRSPRVGVWVLRLTVPALAVAAALVLGSRGAGAGQVVGLWSGPWGWGFLPLSATGWVQGVVGLFLLTVLCAGGWVSLKRTAGFCSLETFRARARTRARMVAGLYSLDARSVVKASRSSRSGWWQTRMHLRPPRHPILVVPWRGTLNLLRSPVRLLWGAGLGAVAVLVLAAAPGRAGSLVGGSVAFYLAAGSLMEPLRLEADAPVISQTLLPWDYGTVLSLHCVVPTVVLIGAGLAALGGGWAAGLIEATTLPAAAALLVPQVVVMVLAAALSARRGGRLPTSILDLTAGDPMAGGFMIVLFWAIGWALLAITGVALAESVGGSETATSNSMIAAAIALSTAAVLLQRVLASSKR